jgi:hypothetical protein
MQDTLITWLMMYLIAAVGTFYIADDIHWLVRLVLSLFWPLTLTTTVIILIVTLIKN